MAIETERGNSSVKATVRFSLKNCPLTTISAQYQELEYRIQEKQVLPKGTVLASLIIKQNDMTDAFFRGLNASGNVRTLDFIYFGKYECMVRTEFECSSCLFLKLNEDMKISFDHLYYKNGCIEAAFSLKDHGEFRDLLKYLKGAGVGFEVLGVKSQRDGASGTGIEELAPSLTPKQLEILKHAYRSGYFDRQRKVNLVEIAEHFELSPATVAAHMRVGLKKILKTMM